MRLVLHGGCCLPLCRTRALMVTSVPRGPDQKVPQRPVLEEDTSREHNATTTFTLGSAGTVVVIRVTLQGAT